MPYYNSVEPPYFLRAIDDTLFDPRYVPQGTDSRIDGGKFPFEKPSSFPEIETASSGLLRDTAGFTNDEVLQVLNSGRQSQMPSTDFSYDAHHCTPALRALFECVRSAHFVLTHAHEPSLKDVYSIFALEYISSLPGCPSIASENLDSSLFVVFADSSNNLCRLCGSHKRSLSRVLTCVRSHLGHRPFHCTGCQSCGGSNG